MAIKIKFDSSNNVILPTFALAKRNGKKICPLPLKSVHFKNVMESYVEFTAVINKINNGVEFEYWDEIKDFRFIWCKEWDVWFEINVDIDEMNVTKKNITAKSICESELSQIRLYGMEINTESDIEREDYKPTIFYNSENPKASLLDRFLEKAPHYRINYVADTITNIQRTFSFDDNDIYSSMQEVAKEIGCHFDFDSGSNLDGTIKREINVYDLMSNCKNVGCRYRGEFTDVCPKCGSVDIDYGFGKDTTIIVSKNNLAKSINYSTNVDSVKNCFKLVAGDDLMTASIINCNPNGSAYLWYISDDMKNDMSEELCAAINKYESDTNYYTNEYTFNIDISNYNNLVKTYSKYDSSIKNLSTTITGYEESTTAYYDAIDFELLLTSKLMPSSELSDTSASEQATQFKTNFNFEVGIAELDASTSKYTASNAVLSAAKVIIDSRYDVDVVDDYSWSYNANKGLGLWSGKFKITNYSDEEDTATTGIITVEVTSDYETYTKQRITKILNKSNESVFGIVEIFDLADSNFRAELKKYCLSSLEIFLNTCQSCIDILIEQGVGSDESDLYEGLYIPYYNKLNYIQNEISQREEEITIIQSTQQQIVSEREKIQDVLVIEKYLGEELWKELASFRREGTYSNSNYISDGLTNSEIVQKANDFIEKAKTEIYKSATLQHSISASLSNLLLMKEFEPIKNDFEIGNWIRIIVDDCVYKLRLLSYEFEFENIDSFNVEFSDVTKISTGISDIESILNSAVSIASSYNSMAHQAEQGSKSSSVINDWVKNGLDAALTKIVNNSENQDVTFGSNGLLCREYNDITGAYSDNQFRLTHNIMAYTNDGWKTVSTALGEHTYNYWNGETFLEDVGYGLTTKFMTSGYVTGSQIIGGEIISSNYVPNTSGTYINLLNGDFEFAGGKIAFDTNDDSLTLKNVTIEWANTNAPEVTVDDIPGLEEYLGKLDNLEYQLDSRAETWYQDSDPSIEWTTDELKALHVGDLWHYTGETTEINGVKRTKNSEWCWQQVDDVYQWVMIEISDEVFDTIDGKSQIFTSTPTPPYNIGDLWVQGSNGDILYCVNNRESGSYISSDWTKSSKYTDDTVAKEALNQAQQGIDDAAKGIRLANAAQSTAETAASRAEQAESNAKKYADSKVGELDTAVGNYLGLDGGTLISSTYLISPYIAGGYLNITNANNSSRVIIDPNNLTGNDYIFQVHNGEQVSVGIKKDGSATFTGTINANGGYIGDIELSDGQLYFNHIYMKHSGTGKYIRLFTYDATDGNVSFLGDTGVGDSNTELKTLYIGMHSQIEFETIYLVADSISCGGANISCGTINGVDIESLESRIKALEEKI